MKTRLFILVLLGSAALLTSGCFKSKEGTTFNYATGNLTATLMADLQQSYDASLKAMDQLQLASSEKVIDALGARIVSTTSAGKKVTISLKPASDKLTQIVIEVGAMGDNDTSKTIYNKIVENLSK